MRRGTGVPAKEREQLEAARTLISQGYSERKAAAAIGWSRYKLSRRLRPADSRPQSPAPPPPAQEVAPSVAEGAPGLLARPAADETSRLGSEDAPEPPIDPHDDRDEDVVLPRGERDDGVTLPHDAVDDPHDAVDVPPHDDGDATPDDHHVLPAGGLEPDNGPAATTPAPESVAALGELAAELGRVEDVQQLRERIEVLEGRLATPDLSERILELEGLLRQRRDEGDELALRVVRLETRVAATLVPELDRLGEEAARSARFDKLLAAVLRALVRVEGMRMPSDRRRGGDT